MSDKNITILLAKANWCGHCQRFAPVFEYSENTYKENSYLKDYDIKFKSFDLADDDEKKNFMLSYLEAFNKVDGYPTILMIKKNNERLNYYHIDHVEVNNPEDRDQIKSSSEIFIKNIENVLKSIDSENKSLFVQVGGKTDNKTLLSEEIYRNKYLKYKSKYLNLKK
jgi:thiol-disulfide isomerase/thioredoxin